MNDFLGTVSKEFEEQKAKASSTLLTELLQQEEYIGELWRIDYQQCEIVVHDFARGKVGGVPLGAFLLASRISPGATVDPQHEDSAAILLRVVGQASLPSGPEMDRLKYLASQRSTDAEYHWDSQDALDLHTKNEIGFSGLRCRVLGSFFVDKFGNSEAWKLRFGADIPNFYSARGMKVFKPSDEVLAQIVNFTKPSSEDDHPLSKYRLPIARVRYSSSERSSNVERVEVNITPSDLIARRTALFGMSRTGKSNTTKTIASAVFGLRDHDADIGRVGQLIFDYNGEYANENVQDGKALKAISEDSSGSLEGDVVTYGTARHPRDPERKLMKVNFFGNDPEGPTKTAWMSAETVSDALLPLTVGKEIIDNYLRDIDRDYIKNFVDASVELPSIYDESAPVRYRRLIFAYRCVLVDAGFKVPGNLRCDASSLFNANLLKAMVAYDKDPDISAAGSILQNRVTWPAAVEAMKGLQKFLSTEEYSAFNRRYIKSSSTGSSWADSTFRNLLGIFKYENGARAVGRVSDFHSADTSSDYADDILEDLNNGRLVIIDQSSGDPDMNVNVAERIMWKVFKQNQTWFTRQEKTESGELIPPPEILIFIEEAHNLLPSGGEKDTRNIWARTAKEGSKYKIGMVYATQEVSSIQSNILKNTDNWFVAHLNCTDEVRELKKYYDFEDFVLSILQAPDPGFIRMRTLSNQFLVPVQVDRFSIGKDR